MRKETLGNFMKTTAVTLILALLGLLFTGCTSLNKTLAIQDAAVAQFHDQYNSGKAAAIWETAHARFQGETEKESFVAYLQSVKGKLGRATSTANVDRRMSTVNEKTMVYLSQETLFEQGKGMETFTIQMDGERALLVAYNVQAKALTGK